jgi:hypothetical protein
LEMSLPIRQGGRVMTRSARVEEIHRFIVL